MATAAAAPDETVVAVVKSWEGLAALPIRLDLEAAVAAAVRLSSALAGWAETAVLAVSRRQRGVLLPRMSMAVVAAVVEQQPVPEFKQAVPAQMVSLH